MPVLSDENASYILQDKKTLFSDCNKIPISEVPLSILNNKVLNSKAFKIIDVPVVLTAVSLAYIPYRERFYDIREVYAPHFERKYDDYTQYLPAAVMLGLKAFGVQGRSSWGRMLTADVFSIGIMAGLVNGLKYTIKLPRPDGSANNSYPSGHTATAFMTASMLHKEYGIVNKWYSIGAYSVATLTGITRVLNNKHWVGDVLFGAAIGIASVELGYFLSDLIFKDRGLSGIDDNEFVWFGDDYCPSFFSLYTAVSAFVGSPDNIKLKESSRIGFEGAWFMNKYVGFGGQTTISTAQIKISDNMMGMISGALGGYFSYPMSDRWRVGTKVLLGMDFMKQSNIANVYIPNYGTSMITGIFVSFLTDRNFGFKLFSDYRHHFSLINSKGISEFNIGISMDIMFGRPAF